MKRVFKVVDKIVHPIDETIFLNIKTDGFSYFFDVNGDHYNGDWTNSPLEDCIEDANRILNEDFKDKKKKYSYIFKYLIGGNIPEYKELVYEVETFLKTRKILLQEAAKLSPELKNDERTEMKLNGYFDY